MNHPPAVASQQNESATQQQQQLYPPPPPYFRHAATGLLTPPPVVEGEYLQFGEIFTTEDGIPALQVRRLYDLDNSDIKAQLLVLHRELAVNFLELLQVLIEKPSAYARQVENVGLVLRNMMHLANQLRPVQARAAVLKSLQDSIEEKKRALEELKRAGEGTDGGAQRAIRLLEEAGAGATTGTPPPL